MTLRSIAAPALICAMLAGSATSQDPHPVPPPPPPPPVPAPLVPVAVITAPASLPADVTLTVFGDQSTTAAPLQWVLDDPKVPYEVTDLGGVSGALFVIRKPIPGVTYRLFLVATGSPPADPDARPTFAFAVVHIPVGLTPTPTPPPAPTPPGPSPTPTPVPVPPPAPVLGHLQATLIFDVDDPSTAQVRVSKIRQELAALDCDWYVAPTASPTGKMFPGRAPEDTIPTVYITDPSKPLPGWVVARIKGPGKVADVLNAVKKLRGIVP